MLPRRGIPATRWQRVDAWMSQGPDVYDPRDVGVGDVIAVAVIVAAIATIATIL